MNYTPSGLYSAVEQELTSRRGKVVVAPWFGESHALALNDKYFVIEAPSALFRDTLDRQFTADVTEIASQLLGRPVAPLFVWGQDAAQWKIGRGDPANDCTFDNFIVGENNRFAHAAAMAVAEQPAQSFNPLVIWGGAGLGKTHLLYAIAGSIRSRFPESNIIYVTTEEFTNAVVEATRTNSFPELHRKYRQADLLLVDDVQFLSGKEATQQEFFNTFEAVHRAGKQIVLTSDRPPREIALLSDRLVSRFEMGLLADVKVPDLETRIALCIDKAKGMGIDVSYEIAQYIASTVTENVREILGVVRKMRAMHDMLGLPIDMDLARQALRDIFKEKPGLHPTPELILNEVANYFSLSAERIKSNTRTKEIVLPRKIACYLIREMTELSLPDIGKFIGQHHTTVLYGIDTLEKQIAETPELRAQIDEIINAIRAK